jgi:TRAP-type C4-dicarboxylate transport system permease small subunit
MNEANPLLNFSDADLKAALRRALRLTAAMALFGFGVLNLLTGWKLAVQFLAGAFVSATGLYEWQQLVELMNAKLDNKKVPRSTGFVLTMFFLRLGVAAAVIYVTLKCLPGPYYALVAGLGLVAVALLIEVARLSRS